MEDYYGSPMTPRDITPDAARQAMAADIIRENYVTDHNGHMGSEVRVRFESLRNAIGKVLQANRLLLSDYSDQHDRFTAKVKELELQISEQQKDIERIQANADRVWNDRIKIIEQLNEVDRIREKAISKNHELAEEVSGLDGKLQESNRLLRPIEKIVEEWNKGGSADAAMMELYSLIKSEKRNCPFHEHVGPVASSMVNGEWVSKCMNCDEPVGR